ncbi:MAG: hypothetical protein ACI3W9_05695, partial [Eubacteriales bacterium]
AFTCICGEGCDNCAVVCESCGEKCSNCSVDICVDCGTCKNCYGDDEAWCNNCNTCGDCAFTCICGEGCEKCAVVCESCGEKCTNCTDEICESCATCADCFGGNLCPGCGVCPDCAPGPVCPDCGMCSDCDDLCSACDRCTGCSGSDHCPNCGICGYCVAHCANCDYCEECADICTDCGEYCSECADICTDCGICENCADILCPNCGICDSCADGMCPDCGSCGDCAELCTDCGSVCNNCAVCCSECGICEYCAEICDDCGMCTDCCSEASEEYGCTHGVCIESEQWKTHYCPEGKHCVTSPVGPEYNETNHWYLCGSECNKKLNVSEHSFGKSEIVKRPTADEDGLMSAKCAVCGYEKQETIPALGSDHTHSFGAEWEFDSSDHWYECICGYKADIEGHTFTWVTDKEAGETEKGSKHEECTVCGYAKDPVEIPPTGTETSDTDTSESGNPSDNPSSGDTPQLGDNGSMLMWLAELLISGFGALVLILFGRKKRRE